jgi:hypothetical protein
MQRALRRAKKSRDVNAAPSSTASARAHTYTIADRDCVTHNRAIMATVTMLSALSRPHWYIGDVTPNSP